MIKIYKKLAAGIDMGGTNLRVGLVDAGGKILIKISEPTKKENRRMLIRQIIKLINSILPKKRTSMLGIGIGAPGPLDQEKGIIFSTPNLPGWKRFNIVVPLKKEFGIPVVLDNDANAAALAEWRFGAGKGFKNMIYLTISTGIGGGIIINGNLYRGLGNAGELGHMIVDWKSKARCGCGNYGDLEALASGTGIKNQTKKDSKEIFEMVKNGNKQAITIINNVLTVLGVGLVNCCHIFDPDIVVLGGSVATNNKEIIFPFLRRFVKENVMAGFRKNIKILPAKLGDDVGIIGAAAAVFEKACFF